MEKILIVEDNIGLANALREIFEVHGYEVRIAHDGTQGWGQLQSEVPSIIISDILMPQMDGFELLQLVRKNTETETLPFVFLTARTEREDLRQGMLLGADDFVTKPFTADDIVQAVEATLNKHRKINGKHETTLTLLRKNITYALPHELRTPLQSVIGYADIMRMEYNTIDPEEIQMMSNEIYKAGNRLHRLIENSLVYAQIEVISSDPKQMEQLRNNILRETTAVIKHTAEIVAEKWKRSGELKLELKDCVLRISSENLSRVIEELVDNAFKFSDTGTKITVKSAKVNNQYVIVIHNKGRGMSAEQIEQIGPYLQFDRVLYEQQGTGLGLTIAKRLVELHEGTFQIHSVPGDSTIITIKLKI